MTLKEDQLNKDLKPHLQRVINEKVTLDDEEAKENIKIMMDVLERLVTALRQVDDLFDALYQRPVYTGSYYENLRVKSADEFDINLVFRLPFNASDAKINWSVEDPAYVTYQLHKDPETLLKEHQKYKSPYDKIMKNGFFDSQNFLQQNKVSQWIQSIISKAMNEKFQLPPGVTLSEWSSITYYLITEQGQIDVDLVPVIDGCCHKPPEGFNPGKRFEQLLKHKGTWFLVPKPFKATSDSGKDEKMNSVRYWRCAFPEAEKELLKDTGCLTLLIKLFKLLRDCHEYWRYPLASYFIKTFFLLEYEKNESKKLEQVNLGTLFMEMLKNFRNVISERKIPYYFNRRANLISGMTPVTSSNIVFRIDKILRKIELNHDYVLELYEIRPKQHATSTYVKECSPQPSYVEDQQLEKKEESSWWCAIL